jgi:hypothetical protein
MKKRTFVYIIFSPRGRVGKTTTARLLADYFLLTGRRFVGFDTDPRESEFAWRFPDQSIVADLSTVRGCMALIDPLLVKDDVPKVIDLWHRSVDDFFNLLEDTQLLAEARRISVEPIMFFLTDPSERSAVVAASLAEHYPDITMVGVNNEGAAPLGEAALDLLASYPTSRSFRIGVLDPILRQAIEPPSFSLSRFMSAPPADMSIVVRSGLRTWLGRILAQYGSFELSMILDEAEHLG